MPRLARVLIPAAAALGISSGLAAAEQGGAGIARAPKLACATLVGREYYNVTVTAAVDMPASGALPAYCRVSGHEAGTDHDLEVRLPARWLGRYVQRGGGGFDGSIAPPASAPAALQLG